MARLKCVADLEDEMVFSGAASHLDQGLLNYLYSAAPGDGVLALGGSWPGDKKGL